MPASASIRQQALTDISALAPQHRHPLRPSAHTNSTERVPSSASICEVFVFALMASSGGKRTAHKDLTDFPYALGSNSF